MPVSTRKTDYCPLPHLPLSLPTRDLITLLLENYVQQMEKASCRRAYEAYYAVHMPEDEAEERTLLADFADAEISPEAIQ